MVDPAIVGTWVADESASARIMPMFPLGQGVLPGERLPLRIFEPRYRQLLRDCQRAVQQSGALPSFGVVMIERGSEVGGGDIRVDVGTLVEFRIAQRDASGIIIVCSGAERIRVVEWLPDNPYPCARVVGFPAPVPTPAEAAAFVEVGQRVRAIYADAQRAGQLPAEQAIPDLDAHDFQRNGVYGWATMSMIEAADRQRLLEAPDVATQYRLFAEAANGLDAWFRFHRS